MKPERLWSNIRRTIQTAVGNELTVDGVQVPVYHDYVYGDPDNLRKVSTEHPLWMETAFLTSGAGRRSDALWQIDVFSRVGIEGEATGDPLGFRLDAGVQAVVDVFSGTDPSGSQRGKFPVKDFLDPQNPVTTSMCVLMQNSDGNVGEVNAVQRLDFSQDFRRASITARFRLIQDAAGTAAFYTG